MIITPEKPVDQLQRDFTRELKSKMKEAALLLHCSVEELKYRVNNTGIVEIERMDKAEMHQQLEDEAMQARIRDIEKGRS